jgi:hypothetical protein
MLRVIPVAAALSVLIALLYAVTMAASVIEVTL